MLDWLHVHSNQHLAVTTTDLQSQDVLELVARGMNGQSRQKQYPAAGS